MPPSADAATHLPRRFARARAALLIRRAGGDASAPVDFRGPAPQLHFPGSFRSGPGLTSQAATNPTQLSTGLQGELLLGSSVTIKDGVVIHAERSVQIGDRVSIGAGSRIVDVSFFDVPPGDEPHCAPIVIEDDVNLESGVVIQPGVTIIRGTTITSGTIVTAN